MSKIGKKPVQFDASKVIFKVEKGGAYNNLVVTVTGPKGELTEDLRPGVKVEVGEGQVEVTRTNDSKQARSYHGLYRSLLANMVEGVLNGYEKKLEIQGVGYRGAQSGEGIELSVGYSHKVKYTPRAGVQVKMESDTIVVVSGINKHLVGQTAAEIRQIKKPEPYKGKGIRYLGEQIRRKAGKAGGA